MATLSKLNFDSISSFADAIKDTLHAKATDAVAEKSQDMKSSDYEESEITEENHDETAGELELSFDTSDLTEIVKIANDIGISYEVESDEITITEEDSTKIDDFLDALDEAGISYDEDNETDDIEEGYTTKSLGHSKDDLERMIEVVRKKRKKNEKAHSDIMDKADKLVLSGKEDNPLRGSLSSTLIKLGNEAKKIESEMSNLLDAWRTIKEDTKLEEGISKKRVHTSARDKSANKKAYRKNKGKLKIKSKRYRKTAKAKRLKKIGVRKAKQGKTATGRRIIKRV